MSAGYVAERNDDDSTPLPRPETLARIRDVTERTRVGYSFYYILSRCAICLQWILFNSSETHLNERYFMSDLFMSFEDTLSTFRFCFDLLDF